MSGLDKEQNPFADPYIALSQGGMEPMPASTIQAVPPPYSVTASSAATFQPTIQPTSQPDTTGFQQQPFGAQQGGQQQFPTQQNYMTPQQPVSLQDVTPMYPASSLQQPGYSSGPQMSQLDLEQRAKELEAREQELNRIQRSTVKENNFPPLPSFFPCRPCYYHAIDIEIPPANQKSCKIMFYIWQFYVLTLLVNFVSSFALLVGGVGTTDSAGTTFGVSLIYLFAFTPCSFSLWYRPIYKALRDDSSFNYMLFFMIFFFQIVMIFISALGIPSFGTVGWINGLAQIARGGGGVGALMIITAIMWSLLAAAMIIYYKRIHSAYRSSGASFEKAQGELAAGIASNKTVQNVAVESVRAGMTGGPRGGAQTMN